jgi:hypothetical protein
MIKWFLFTAMLSVISLSPAFCMDPPSEASGLIDATRRVTKYVRIDDEEPQAPGAAEFESAKVSMANADAEYEKYKKFKFAERKWALSRIAKIDGAYDKAEEARAGKHHAKKLRLNYLKDAAAFLEVALQSGFQATKHLAMVCFQLDNREYRGRSHELLKQLKGSNEAETIIAIFGL